MTNKILFAIIFSLTILSCNTNPTVNHYAKRTIPDSLIEKYPLFIRTDFANDNIWNEVCTEIKTPSKSNGFIAYVNFLNDAENRSQSKEQIISSLPKNYNHTFIFIYDSISSTHKDNIILCVDLYGPSHRTFRIKPKDLWIVENNLSIANADFDDYAKDVDKNNIFRGLH